jgi:carbon monoxide dehydrogenase subunit G
MFNKMVEKEKNTNEKTTNVSASRDIPAPLERVWAIVSDVDNEPKYYSGLNSVKNVSKNDNVIEREVTVGFRGGGQKSRQRVEIDNQNKLVIVTIIEGHIKGTRIVSLTPTGDNNSKTNVNVSWALDLSAIPFVGRSIVRRNLEKTTEDALTRLAEEFGS